MARKPHRRGEIVVKLRQIEVLTAQGKQIGKHFMTQLQA